jgi:hypothetical protein
VPDDRTVLGRHLPDLLEPPKTRGSQELPHALSHETNLPYTIPENLTDPKGERLVGVVALENVMRALRRADAGERPSAAERE